MMRDDAWKVYEGWRSVWLSGGDGNAIAALRFHGLRGALAVAGTASGRPEPLPRSSLSIDRELPIADAVITEAASQVRRLCMPVAAMLATATPDNREDRHV